MRKLIDSVLIFIVLLCSVSLQTFAVGPDSGSFGYDNLTWSFDTSETLTISGKGSMSINWKTGVPWREHNSQIKTVIVQDGVTDIGAYAFADCFNLSSITIPDSVTSIGRYAFCDCKSLSRIDLPKKLEILGGFAFMGCSSLVDIEIPSSVLTISDGVFHTCSSLKSISIPEGATGIYELAFYRCTNLENVNIPDSITRIGENAFAYTNVKNIVLPDSITKIEERAFEDCEQLKSITIPSSVESIGPYTFLSCKSLTNVTIPQKVTKIEEYTFCGCSGLKSIVIPSGVVSIGECAFYNCKSISSITVPTSVKKIGDKAFYGVSAVIYATDGHTQELAKTNNISKNNYDYYASPVLSYLYQDGNNLVRVESDGGDLIVETYTSDFQPISAKRVKHELSYKSTWGGFFSGEKYNFIIVGLNNPQESDSAEVVRVIKYDKNWNELGHASLYGADTLSPFDAGSVRCAEYNGILYIHTSHTMYQSADGLHHQANMTLSVQQSNMTIKKGDPVYASHSFNQFILIDQDHHAVMLDHGDGYPRAAVMVRKTNLAGSMSLSGDTIGVLLQKFPGMSGNNITGASLGGLTETKSGYIAAYNYNGGFEISEVDTPPIVYVNGVDQAENAKYARNVYLSYAPKANFGKAGASILQVTSYDPNGQYSASTPQLVSTGLDGGYVLWEVRQRNDNGQFIPTGNISYAAYDSTGQISAVRTVRGALSDCQPIIFNGRVTWYVTQDSEPLFYLLNATGLSKYRSPEFSDVRKGSWFYDAVRFVYNNGIMASSGGVYSFEPNTMADRGTIVTALYNMDDLKDSHGVTRYFDDVDDELRPMVSWALVNRITNGYDTWHFGPSNSVTREQFATFMFRYAQSKGYDTSKRAQLAGYSDYYQISDYAKEAMQWANAEGLITGTSSTTLSPKGTTTRAVVATILMRFCDKLVE